MIRQGLLPVSAVPEMLKLWDSARAEVRDLDSETWSELTDALHYWIHPDVLG